MSTEAIARFTNPTDDGTHYQLQINAAGAVLLNKERKITAWGKFWGNLTRSGGEIQNFRRAEKAFLKAILEEYGADIAQQIEWMLDDHLAGNSPLTSYRAAKYDQIAQALKEEKLSAAIESVSSLPIKGKLVQQLPLNAKDSLNEKIIQWMRTQPLDAKTQKIQNTLIDRFLDPESSSWNLPDTALLLDYVDSMPCDIESLHDFCQAVLSRDPQLSDALSTLSQEELHIFLNAMFSACQNNEGRFDSEQFQQYNHISILEIFCSLHEAIKRGNENEIIIEIDPPQKMTAEEKQRKEAATQKKRAQELNELSAIFNYQMAEKASNKLSQTDASIHYTELQKQLKEQQKRESAISIPFLQNQLLLQLPINREIEVGNRFAQWASKQQWDPLYKKAEFIHNELKNKYYDVDSEQWALPSTKELKEEITHLATLPLKSLSHFFQAMENCEGVVNSLKGLSQAELNIFLNAMFRACQNNEGQFDPDKFEKYNHLSILEVFCSLHAEIKRENERIREGDLSQEMTEAEKRTQELTEVSAIFNYEMAGNALDALKFISINEFYQLYKNSQKEHQQVLQKEVKEQQKRESFISLPSLQQQLHRQISRDSLSKLDKKLNQWLKNEPLSPLHIEAQRIHDELKNRYYNPDTAQWDLPSKEKLNEEITRWTTPFINSLNEFCPAVQNYNVQFTNLLNELPQEELHIFLNAMFNGCKSDNGLFDPDKFATYDHFWMLTQFQEMSGALTKFKNSPTTERLSLLSTDFIYTRANSRLGNWLSNYILELSNKRLHTLEKPDILIENDLPILKKENPLDAEIKRAKEIYNQEIREVRARILNKHRELSPEARIQAFLYKQETQDALRAEISSHVSPPGKIPSCILETDKSNYVETTTNELLHFINKDLQEYFLEEDSHLELNKNILHLQINKHVTPFLFCVDILQDFFTLDLTRRIPEIEKISYPAAHILLHTFFQQYQEAISKNAQELDNIAFKQQCLKIGRIFVIAWLEITEKYELEEQDRLLLLTSVLNKELIQKALVNDKNTAEGATDETTLAEVKNRVRIAGEIFQKLKEHPEKVTSFSRLNPNDLANLIGRLLEISEDPAASQPSMTRLLQFTLAIYREASGGYGVTNNREVYARCAKSLSIANLYEYERFLGNEIVYAQFQQFVRGDRPIQRKSLDYVESRSSSDSDAQKIQIIKANQQTGGTEFFVPEDLDSSSG